MSALDVELLARVELRRGYTLDSLTRMAHYAARNTRWNLAIDLGTRYGVAWSGMAEQLYAADQQPTPGDLIRAGWLAISRHRDAERQFQGCAHDGPARPGNHVFGA